MEEEIVGLKARIEELEAENLRLKRDRVEIQEAKELYLKIFEEFPALIWRSGLDKLCNYFNRTWLEFTGRTIEQEYGNGWTEGLHPDDMDVCLQTYVSAFDKREPFLMEYRMKNRHGAYRWIRDIGRPFYDFDHTFLGYIGSCYDVTEMKENEIRLVELNATKDKFFSIVAHDLKTPFSSIVGFSGLLVESAKAKNYLKIDEYAGVVLHSSNRAMDLLTNLLTWSQLESGRLMFKPGYFDVWEVVDEVLLLLNPLAEQKCIEVENYLLLGSMVYADRDMVSTVIRNLVSNALKFTEPNRKVSILGERMNNALVVRVSDEGVGISGDRLGTLFNVAENVSTYGTQHEKGTGLGLILCKEFVERNKGAIWVESTLGKGSVFSFTLPVAY